MDDHQLIAVLLNEAGADEAGLVARACETDAAVAARMDFLRQMLADLQGEAVAAQAMAVSVEQKRVLAGLLGPATRGRLWGLRESLGGLVGEAAEGARRAGEQVVGLLVHDSWRNAAAGLGYRGGAGVDSERLRRYAFDGVDVDVRVAGSETVGGVAGFLVQCEVEGATIQAARLIAWGGDDAADAQASALVLQGGVYGEATVPAGVYTLSVLTGAGELVIEGLAVGTVAKG
jgi:hypothetical protein